VQGNFSIGIQIAILWANFALIISAAIYWYIRNREARFRGPDLALTGGIFLTALVLRMAVSPHTIIHENAHAYEYLRTAFTGEGYPFHGAGYYAFYRMVTLVLGQEPLVVFGCNAVLNSLTAALLIPLGRLLFTDRWIGPFAGLVYALWPAALRIAASESMFPLALFIGVATLCVWLSAIRSGDRILYCLAGLLLAVAVQVRPVMILWPFIIIVSTISQPLWRKEILKFGPLWSAMSFLVMSPVWVAFRIFDLQSNGLHSAVDLSPIRNLHLLLSNENLLWNNHWSPYAVLILAALGLFAMLASNWRHAVVFAISCLVLYWFALAPSAGAAVSQLRLQSPIHLFVALSAGSGAAFLLERIPRRHRLAGSALLAVVLSISSSLCYDAVRAEYNPQIEYKFLRDSVKTLPAECAVVTANRSMANGVITTEFPTWWLDSRPLSTLSERESDSPLVDQTSCVIWYRGLTCYSFTWQEQAANVVPHSGLRQKCENFEAGTSLLPIVETSFHNRPYLSYIRPNKEILELGFYRLQEQSDE